MFERLLLLIMALLVHQICISQVDEIDRDSIDQLIKSERVDTSKLNHIIKAITDFEFHTQKDLEFYFKAGSKLATKTNAKHKGLELYYQTARQLLKIQEYEAALEKYIELSKIAQASASIKYQSLAQFGIAQVEEKKGNTAPAMQYLQEALQLLENSQEYELQANILTKTAHLERILGNPRQALLLFNQAEILYVREAEIGNYLELLNGKGRTYRALGVYDSARLTYHQVIEIALRENEDGSLARAYNNLGNIDHLTGDIEAALGHYVKSLEIKERIGNKRGIALAHHNIATIKAAMSQHTEAIESYIKSRELAREIDYTSVVQINELRIGNSYHELDKLDSALLHHNNALEIAKSRQDKNGVALCYINLGEDYVKLKDFNSALDYLTKALSIAKETGNKSYQGAALSYIATTYLSAQNITENDGGYPFESTALSDRKIEEYLLEAKHLAEEVNNYEGKKVSLNGLQYLYEKIGNHKANAAILQEHLVLNDSIFTKERTKAIAEWETKYETAEKEKEIAILEASEKESEARIKFWSVVSILLLSILGIGTYLYVQLQKIRQKLVVQNDQLVELNQTKDKFFGIIAHDIRSPIVALQSVDEQIEYFLKKEDIGRLTKLGGLVGKTARHLNSLLDNLLNWALVQTNTIPYNPEYIDVHRAWLQTKDLLEANAEAKEISIASAIPEGMKVFADSASFSTILRNLTSNALKFSNHKSTITFKAKEDNGFLLFEVRDEGIGMSPDKLASLFRLDKKSQTGTAGEKGTGLGLILCKDLVELNKGKISAESKEGEGSVFRFLIPKLGE